MKKKSLINKNRPPGSDEYHIGIDAGSVSLNAAAVDRSGEFLDKFIGRLGETPAPELILTHDASSFIIE